MAMNGPSLLTLLLIYMFLNVQQLKLLNIFWDSLIICCRDNISVHEHSHSESFH